MTSWRLLSLATSSASPIAGSAGSIASIASAFDAISAAIRATNSAVPGPLQLATGLSARVAFIAATWRSTGGVTRRITTKSGEPSMIVVHHLENSRSQRLLWMIEELGLPYEIHRYSRDPKTM